MSNFTIFCTVVIFLALFFNSYKIGLMIKSDLTGVPYEILPWSPHPIKSGSNPTWLLIHLAISLFNLLVTYGNIITYRLSGDFWRRLHHISHVLFVIIMSFNMTHLGNCSSLLAIILIAIPLIMLISFYAISYQNELRLPVYFVTLSLPVILETVLYFIYVVTQIMNVSQATFAQACLGGILIVFLIITQLMQLHR